jgi:HEAT repeat protein
LAIELAAQFPALSTTGQEAALEVHALLVHAGSDLSASQDLAQATAEILSAAAGVESGSVRAHALALLEQIDKDVGPYPEFLSSSRRLVTACLSDKQTNCRMRALQLARRPEMGLVNEVVGLLNDPEPELRRSAMLIVGPIESAITTDSLLHWLHDPDIEVRGLCEKALRARGLQDAHLLLGRTMTDSRPGTRLQVIELLKRADDLEPGVWLRRLSHDPSAAVRAAAVRAAAEQSLAQLADRLEQMSQNDPCATVRQLAQFYLSTYH